MPTRYRLNNGLTVVFEERHAAKVAAFQVWVRAGSADEREDQAGLAHLHEHMLFKGTARRGPGEIARDIEAHGGEINAWTSFDQTVYHIVIASQFAKKGLDILGDAVRNSSFDAEELAREIEVVCEEIKRGEDMPAQRAAKALFSTAFSTHPYMRPVIGWENTVRGFTRDKVLEFFHRHYTPDNMVLAAVGDLDPEAFKQWAEEILGGDWGRRHEGAVTRATEPTREGRLFALKEDDVRETYFKIAFPIPAVQHPDTPTLDLLALLIGQGDASRLNMEVKRKRSLVNEIYLYAYTPQDPGLLVLSLTAQPAHLQDALRESIRILAQLHVHPVSQGELATAKSLFEAEAVYQRESVEGLARKLGFYECAAGGIEKEARYYEKIAALSSQDVLDVAKRYIRFDRASIVGLFPNGQGVSREQIDSLIDEVLAEQPLVPADRKVPKTTRSQPMRVTPIAVKASERNLIVEKLPSGASVLIRPEASVPLFAARAVFQGGIRYERPGESGLTTLLMRMMTRGTKHHDAEEISHLVDDYSGSLGGASGRSSVGLRGEFLSKHFAPAFSLFADCLLEPRFVDSEFDREKKLILQDIHRREDRPSSLAMDLFSRALYPDHPYRLQVFPEPSAVEALTPEILAEHHARYMDPSQMTLCVVGDVNVDEVMHLATVHFGKTSGRAAPAPAIQPVVLPKRTVEHRNLQKAQAHLVYGFLGVRVSDPSRRALEVLSTVLAGQGGRLFVELRDKRSMAYSVSSFSVEGIDPGYFAVYMGTSPEKLDDAFAGINIELDKVRNEKISAAELQRAQRHLVGTHEIGLQRNGSRAAVLALDHLYDVKQSSFFDYAEQIFAVTVEDVQAVAEKVIQPEHSVLATVGPRGLTGV